MLESEFLRRQAARLKSLADQIGDAQAAAAVATVACKIEERAAELERDGDEGAG